MGWQKIKNEYIAGEATLRELATKYEVSFSTIQKKSSEEGWNKLRKKKRRITEEKIIETVSSQDAKKAVNIIDVADKLLMKIVDVADMVSDPDSIKKLTSAIKDLKDIKGIKSDADMREQEARIAKLQKEAEDEVKTDNNITVTILGGEDSYSK